MLQTTSYPKDKIKILLLENISEIAAKGFIDKGYPQVERLPGALSEKELTEKIKNVHILGIRSKTQITENILSAANKLQEIGCFCIGTNQVDLKAASHHGVAVFNAPYSNTRSVAELIIGLSIMLIRKIPEKNLAAHHGIWLKETTGSHELRGKTLGIIGYGNIGSQLSILAEGLGMRVIYFDPMTKLPLGNATGKTNLEEVLREADIISLHVPALPSTKGMIQDPEFKKMKQGSLFLNYSRGNVVDLEALKNHLENGHLGGAAIDVYPVEPQKSGASFKVALQNLPNVILTPHIGGSTEEAQVNIGVDVSHKLIHYLENGYTLGSFTVPELDIPIQDHKHRILHIHKNVPGVLSAINAALSEEGINIQGQYLKTNPDIGYVVLDIDKAVSKKAFKVLAEIPNTIKTRLLY